MCNKVKKINKKQKGFAMLEVMLAVLIIAIASFGIYKLYSSASTRSSIATTSGVVNQVAGAVSKYANVYMSAPDIDKLMGVGYLPVDLVATDKTLKTPFGAMTYTAGTTGYDSFSLTVSVPGSSAIDFAKDMSAVSDVKVDDADFKGDGTDKLSSSVNNHAIVLNFPKASS